MKKITSLILLGILIILSPTLSAQWTQKANLPATSRAFSAGFSIGTKIYLCGGSDNNLNIDYKDVWEYNVLTNVWTQKSDFPGGLRFSAVAFSIGSKGYFGTGNDSFTYYNDFWEYDPATDTWTQKANFPGDPREEAVGFNIGGKGYIGSGQSFFTGPNSSFTLTYSDFFEYDPTTDTWIQKANIPGNTRAYAAGCGIGNKGYLGFGADANQTISYTDFYEYNPSTDIWTAKNTGPGYSRADAGMFTIGTDCYLLGGINFANFSATSACVRYNTLTDSWTSVANIPNGIIASPVAVSSNGKGYAGTGFNATLNARQDWWEFSPTTSTVVTYMEEKNNLPQAISIYPNPIIKDFTVTFNSNSKTTPSSFLLINSLGEQVFCDKLNLNNGAAQKIVMPDDISKGIYTFKVVNEHGIQIAVKKIVKE